jgi:hypothetical protein
MGKILTYDKNLAIRKQHFPRYRVEYLKELLTKLIDLFKEIQNDSAAILKFIAAAKITFRFSRRMI